MEIWVDSCDVRVIEDACQYGVIYGVTTNPTLLAKLDCDLERGINCLLDIQDGPVAIQVVAEDVEAIVNQALQLHSFSDRIIVKIPVTQQGLIAMKQLEDHKLQVMATAIFSVNQALLASLAGADYLAPYVGRMYSNGIDALEAMQIMKKMLGNYQLKSKIIAAGLQSAEQVTSCAAMGISAVTLKDTLFYQFISDDSNTLESLEGFSADWQKSRHKNSMLSLDLNLKNS